MSVNAVRRKKSEVTVGNTTMLYRHTEYEDVQGCSCTAHCDVVRQQTGAVEIRAPEKTFKYGIEGDHLGHWECFRKIKDKMDSLNANSFFSPKKLNVITCWNLAKLIG